VFRALEPWPLKFIFDRVFHGPRRGKWSDFAFLQSVDSSVLIVSAGLALLAIAALRALAAYVSTITFVRLGNRVLTEVRADVYRHLQGLSLSFHRHARNGELVLRVMSDVNLLKDVVVTALLPLLANFLVLICTFGIMFWLNARLALLALLLLPLVGLWTARLGGQIRDTARKQRKRDAGLAAAAAETFSAIAIVQAFGPERVFADTFVRRNQESNGSDVRAARLSAALERGTAFFVAAGTALVVWYGATLVLRGELTPGELLVFLAYLKTALRPVQDLSKFIGRFAKAAAAGDRVLKLAAENLCRACAEEFDLPLVVLRYFSIYGPRQRPDIGYYRFIHALLRHQRVPVRGDGLQIRGNTYIDDCCEATVAALEAPVGEVYNVGGGEKANVWEILKKLEAILDCRAVIRREPPRPGDQRFTAADTARIFRHLGWRPRVGLDEGLALQAAWQRSL
jgi:ABC-type multidrug transport system fused ATPase/permease subunit